jgi:anti-sigma factor RsiW
MSSNCEKYQRLISDFLDDGLTPDSNAELARHLEVCSDCREFEEMVRRQKASIQVLPVFDTAMPLPKNHQEQGLWGRLWRVRISIPVPAAALVIMAAVALGILWPREAPSSSSPARSTAIEEPIRTVQVERLTPTHAVRLPANFAFPEESEEEL